MLNTLKKIKDFLLVNRTARQTIAKNTFWLFISQILSRVIRAVIVILAARILGADLYGIFTFAISFAALFGILGDLGVWQIVMREIAKDVKHKEKFIASGLALKAILNAVSYITIILFAFAFAPIQESKIVIVFIAVAFVFDSFREFGNTVVKALEKMQVDAAVTITNHIATVILGVGALLIWKTPLALAIAYAAGSFVGFCVIAYYLRDIIPKLKKSFRMETARAIMKDAWPFAFLGITAVILTNTDAVMLGWFMSTEQVGFYGAAIKPIQLLFVLPALVAVALFPALSRASAAGDKTSAALIERSLGAVIVLALPIVVGGMLMSDLVIRALYGTAYFASIAPFQILLLIVLLNFPATIMGYAILAHNKQVKTIKYFAFAAIVNIVLNYLFITRWGIVGAATATTISQLIATTGYYLVIRNVEKLRIAQYLWRPLAASLTMGVIILILRNLGIMLPAIFIIAVIVYPLFLVLLRDPIVKEVKKSFALKI